MKVSPATGSCLLLSPTLVHLGQLVFATWSDRSSPGSPRSLVFGLTFHFSLEASEVERSKTESGTSSMCSTTELGRAHETWNSQMYSLDCNTELWPHQVGSQLPFRLWGHWQKETLRSAFRWSSIWIPPPFHTQDNVLFCFKLRQSKAGNNPSKTLGFSLGFWVFLLILLCLVSQMSQEEGKTQLSPLSRKHKWMATAEMQCQQDQISKWNDFRWA